MKSVVARTLLLVATVAVFVAACGPGTTSPNGACSEPEYLGAATDEVLIALIDGKNHLQPADDRTPTLTNPTPSAVLPNVDTAPTITWSDSLVLHDVPAAPHTLPPRVLRPWSPLDVVTPLFIPTAHAHLPPVTGPAYWVEILAPGVACPIASALTSTTSWTLDADVWAAVRTHKGEALTVRFTSAYLVETRISEGAYQSTVPFTIE